MQKEAASNYEENDDESIQVFLLPKIFEVISKFKTHIYTEGQ